MTLVGCECATVIVISELIGTVLPEAGLTIAKLGAPPGAGGRLVPGVVDVPEGRKPEGIEPVY